MILASRKRYLTKEMPHWSTLEVPFEGFSDKNSKILFTKTKRLNAVF
jgi:hypothetical protein